MKVSVHFKPAMQEIMAQTSNKLRAAGIVVAILASVFVVTLPATIPAIVVAYKKIRADYKQEVANQKQRALNARKITTISGPSVIQIPKECDSKKFGTILRQILDEHNFLLLENGEICTSRNELLGESAKNHVYRLAKRAYDRQEAKEAQEAISAATKAYEAKKFEHKKTLSNKTSV